MSPGQSVVLGRFHTDVVQLSHTAGAAQCTRGFHARYLHFPEDLFWSCWLWCYPAPVNRTSLELTVMLVGRALKRYLILSLRSILGNYAGSRRSVKEDQEMFYFFLARYLLISKPPEWSSALRFKFLEGFYAFLELLKCMQVCPLSSVFHYMQILYC